MNSPLLSIDGLVHSYRVGDEARPVLDGVTFEVHRGETVCIVGHSGTGKSTLLRCLAGLLRPTAGTVRFNGQQVTEPPAEVAVVFQDYSRSLLPWMRIRGNVTLPLLKTLSRKERDARADQALEAVGLAGNEDLYPWQVSGGMQQRVAIARALAYDPTLLLMDEPFASVDAQTRAELEDLLLRIQGELGVTVALVTHDIDEAVYLGDRVVVLSGRPAAITADIPVRLASPRDQITTKADPRYIDARSEVLTLIRRATAPTPTSALDGVTR